MNTASTQKMKVSNPDYFSPLEFYLSGCKKKKKPTRKRFFNPARKKQYFFPPEVLTFPLLPLLKLSFIIQENSYFQSLSPLFLNQLDHLRRRPLTIKVVYDDSSPLQFDKHSSSYCSTSNKPPRSVSPVLPLLHHLRHPIELARSQCWELSNLKVILQRWMTQGCWKKRSLSYTCRSLTLDKCRVYPFWKA